MENNGRNSDRDKMLEEILGSLGSDSNTPERSTVKTASERPSPRNVGKTEQRKSANDERPSDKNLKTSNSSDGLDFMFDEENRYRPVSEDTEKRKVVNTENPEERKITASQMPAARPRRKKKKNSARLQIVLILTVVIFTIAICLAVMIISVGKDMLAIGKAETYKIITIPDGADVKDISKILYDEGIIKIPRAFEIVAKMSGNEKDFKPGEYELSPSNAYETIITALITDEYVEGETVNVTFPEGVDLHTAAMQLEEAGVCDADRFIYYFNAGGYECEFEKLLPESSASRFYRMEGYLFPDTYTFYVDMEPELVCSKIYKNFDDKITDDMLSRMDEIGLSLDETITLASIVQAEAPDTQTMKLVASVFLNRLHNSDEFPKLESDPTGKYVNNVIKPNIEIQSQAIYDSYDTYICNGLPSGAIGNPGLDAIEAVLYPADTDYYFFYANLETRETFFAETIEEHEANIDMVLEQQSGSGDEDDEDY